MYIYKPHTTPVNTVYSVADISVFTVSATCNVISTVKYVIIIIIIIIIMDYSNFLLIMAT
jgi:hypothetical protein